MRIVDDEASLKAAVDHVLTDLKQTALVEEFIEGREVNVGILGNSPPEAFPVLELLLGGGNNKVYAHEAKFVLLRGINNDKHVMKKLVHGLLRIRVRPSSCWGTPTPFFLRTIHFKNVR